MKKLILIITTSILLAACSSPPKVKEPSGKWIQINNPQYYQEHNTILGSLILWSGLRGKPKMKMKT